MQYVTTLDRAPDGCVFCEITRSEDGPGNLVMHRGAHAYVVLNLYPYNNGHAMVIPFRHVASLRDLNDDERLETMQLASVLQAAMEESMGAQGFNLGMNLGRVGGAGIPGHLHLHVVPRWMGDTNFMPVGGETKVLPESLEATYARLSAAIRAEIERGGARR
jgi:ATP adenylyltransferase